MPTLVYFFPLIGAVTGWMLHALVIHKIIPASQRAIAKNTGKWVGANLVASFKLDEKLRDPSHFEKIKPLIESHIDEFLRVKLGKQMPMLSMFIGDKTVEKMKSVFMDELQQIFPQVIGNFAGNLEKEIDVEKLVAEKLGSMDAGKWKTAVKQKLGKQINDFRLLGAVTGFIIGTLFVVLMLFIL